jgi:hypothetical protein
MASRTSETSARAVPAAKRGLIGHVWALLTQPKAFFTAFPTSGHWLVVAFVMLALVGVMAVARGSSAPITPPVDVDAGGGGFFPNAGGGGINLSPSSGGVFDVPLPSEPLPSGEAGAPNNTTAQVTTALIASAGALAVWAGQAVCLLLVTFASRQPSLGRAFQVAVWASLPYALMMGAQWAFRSAGGTASEAGLSALLMVWADYATLPEAAQLVVKSLLVQTTLFSLWNVYLLWLGARKALKGNPLVVAFALGVWLSVAVLVPVVSGQVSLPLKPIDGELMPPIGEGVPVPSGGMTFEEVPVRPNLPPASEGRNG